MIELFNNIGSAKVYQIMNTATDDQNYHDKRWEAFKLKLNKKYQNREDIQLINNFSDEFTNFFNIALLRTDESGDLTKVAVLHIDDEKIDKKTRIMTLLSLLADNFEWSFIVINKHKEYSTNEILENIDNILSPLPED